MYLKWCGAVVVLLALVGCKDLLNKPLQGDDADASRYPLTGNWVADEKAIRLEFKKTDKADWYQFVVREPNRSIEGKLMVASFKRKLALSVDVASVKLNGEPLVRNDNQGYFLIGAYYEEDEIRLVPVSIEKFERNFADYFFAAPIETASFCERTNQTCKETFSEGNLLYSKNRRKFNEDFVKHFRTIFPRRDSVAFVPAS